eukprot:scaffold53562_cov43-Attheya_sp.AAC.1
MYVDQSSATVAFLSSVLSPYEKGVVLWGAVISQGQQQTNTHCVWLCVRVFCLLSPTDLGIVWRAWELVVTQLILDNPPGDGQKPYGDGQTTYVLTDRQTDKQTDSNAICWYISHVERT